MVQGKKVTPKEAAKRRHRARPEVRDRAYLVQQARYQALSGLARRHPAEYTRLYLAELEHLGITPPPMERPCPACPAGIIRRKAPVGAWPKVCEKCGQAARKDHRKVGGPA